MTCDFHGKRVLVTGGTSGIGNAAVKLFSEAGAKVYFTGRNDELGQETMDLIPQTTFIHADATNEAEVEAVFTQIDLESKGVDILFNNIGIISIGFGPLTRLKLLDWEQCFQVNLTSVMLHMKYALQRMGKQKNGVIINNAAILGNVKYNQALPAYSAAKSGIIALTKSAAIRHAKDNIRINSISPGPTLTALTNKAYGGEKFVTEAALKHPRGSFASPEEIARVVLFLASDDASYIHGADLVADGGYSLT